MFVLLYWKDTEIYGQKALEIYENLDKVSEHPECYPIKPLHMKFNDFELELWQLFWKETLVINSTEHMRYNNLWKLKNPGKLKGAQRKSIFIASLTPPDRTIVKIWRIWALNKPQYIAVKSYPFKEISYLFNEKVIRSKKWIQSASLVRYKLIIYV